MTEKVQVNHEKWFDEQIQIYESLAANVANTLRTALDKNNIMYVDIPYRAKTKKSFLKKWDVKEYQSVNQVMDLAGIRVITLVESDLDEVEELIKALFRIHENDSGDKSKDLGHEKFGYRSRHFVCDIGTKREELIELDHFKDMKFEIQIRTALAHAWAEIEHDKGYKLEEGLPEKFKRRLNIVAAMLEGADNEFNRLTNEINEYIADTQNQIATDELDLEISRVSIQELIIKKYSQYVSQEKYILQEKNTFSTLEGFLGRFGLKTIKELDDLITQALSNNPSWNDVVLEIYGKDWLTDFRFVGTMLLLSDIDLFFDKRVWSGQEMNDKFYDYLNKFFTKDKVIEILEKSEMERTE